MKIELTGLLFLTAALGGAGAANGDPDTIPTLGMALCGGTLAAAWSVKQSRREHENRTDTIINAYLALAGALGLAFALSPTLADKVLRLGDFGNLSLPAYAWSFLISVGSARPLEELLRRGPIGFVRWIIGKAKYAEKKERST